MSTETRESHCPNRQRSLAEYYMWPVLLMALVGSMGCREAARLPDEDHVEHLFFEIVYLQEWMDCGEVTEVIRTQSAPDACSFLVEAKCGDELEKFRLNYTFNTDLKRWQLMVFDRVTVKVFKTPPANDGL